jgi:hypothetical protein
MIYNTGILSPIHIYREKPEPSPDGNPALARERKTLPISLSSLIPPPLPRESASPFSLGILKNEPPFVRSPIPLSTPSSLYTTHSPDDWKNGEQLLTPIPFPRPFIIPPYQEKGMRLSRTLTYQG